MSIKDAYAFIARMKDDNDFRTNIEQATADEQKNIAQGAGFQFSKDELMQAMKNEIDDEMLDDVAGGVDCSVDCNGLQHCPSAYNCGSDCHHDDECSANFPQCWG